MKKLTLSRSFTTVRVVWAAAASLLLVTAGSRAATDTWTGGGAPDGNWLNPANWGGTAPGAGDPLLFDTSNQTAATNNFANGTIFGSLDFNASAGAFLLWPVSGGDGSGLVLTNSAGIPATTSVTGGSIANASPNDETIGLPVTLSAGNHVLSTAGGAGALNFGGALTRNADATVQFLKSGGDINAAGSGLANLNGILGGWAVIGLGLNAGDWAALDGSQKVVAYSSYTTKSGGSNLGLSSSGGNAANNIKINTRSSTACTLNSTTAGTYDINTLLWNVGSTPGGDQTLNISSGQLLRLGANGAIMNVHADNRTFNLGNGSSGIVTAGGGAGVAGELSLYSVSFANGNARLQIKCTIADNGSSSFPVRVNTLGDVQYNFANTYSGGTFINIGRLWVNNVGSLGAGPVTVFPGGEVSLNNSSSGTYPNNFFLYGYGSAGIADPLVVRQANATATLSGTITLLGPACVIAPNGNVLTLSGNLTGPGGLYVMGAYNNGSLHLDEASPNTYAGDTTIDAAGLGNDLNHAITIWIDNSTHNNIMPNGSGAGNLVLNGGGSVLAQFDLGGSSQTINGLISSGNALETLVTSNPGGGTLYVGANNASSEYDGVIGTSGGNGTANLNLTKIGSGTLTLGGANNYTGSTTVSNGVLALTAFGSIALSGQVAVNSGATLDVSQTSFTLGAGQTLLGSGAVNGSVNTVAGSGISPGFGVGTLTLSNDLTLVTGATCVFDLSATVNGANDRLVVGGNLNLAGATIQVNAASLQVGRYKLITYGGSESGTAAANLALSYNAPGVTAVLDDSLPHELDLLVQPGAPETLTWKGDGTANFWDVGATPNWSTNGSGSFVFTNGSFVVFDDRGSKAPPVALAGTLQPLSLLVSNNTGTYTFSGGSLSGASALLKKGSGSLVLTESGDTFTGGLLASNGLVVLDNDSSGVTGGTLVGPGATVQVGNNDASGVLPTGSVTNFGTLSFNRVDDVAVANFLAGTGPLVKNGPAVVDVTAANAISGGATINAGTLRGWTAANFGTSPGSFVISDGATLDRGWLGVGPITAGGAGVGGTGAIVNNSSGNAIYDGSGGMTPSLTLSGDTTFGGNTRWDLGSPCVLSTGGSNYNLSISMADGVYMEWDNVTIDPNLGDIDIYTAGGGSLGIKGCGLGLGNPNNTITVHSNSALVFWGETTNNSGYAKNIHVMGSASVSFRPNTVTGSNAFYNTTLLLDDGAGLNLFNGSGAIGTVLMQPVTLNGLVHVQIGDSACTLSNVISGPGGFYLDNFNNLLKFAAANTYTGVTDLRAGRTLALIGNGSIANSSSLVLEGGATLNATGRVDGTFTLAAGQSLQTAPSGTVSGRLATLAGSALLPGGTNAIGILTVSSNTTLAGTVSMDVDKDAATNDLLSVSGTSSLQYGGTLVVSSLTSALANGDSLKLFNAGSYSGTFAAISPATPGAGLRWDTNSLTSDGTLNVALAVNPNPTNLVAMVEGNQLILSWPADHTGWHLQAQTNTPGRLGTNWSTIPGTDQVNSYTNVLDSSVGSVFYRMVYP